MGARAVTQAGVDHAGVLELAGGAERELQCFALPARRLEGARCPEERGRDAEIAVAPGQPGGNRLDRVMPTHREVGVVDRTRFTGEVGIVLGVHRHVAGFRELAEHRHHHAARLAFALDDRHDTFGEHWCRHGRRPSCCQR